MKRYNIKDNENIWLCLISDFYYDKNIYKNWYDSSFCSFEYFALLYFPVHNLINNFSFGYVMEEDIRNKKTIKDVIKKYK